MNAVVVKKSTSLKSATKKLYYNQLKSIKYLQLVIQEMGFKEKV